MTALKTSFRIRILAEKRSKLEKRSNLIRRKKQHCHERKNKRSMSRHIKLVHTNSKLQGDENAVPNPNEKTTKLNQKTGKIIQPVEHMETIPEEHPVVEWSGVQDEDTGKVINCIPGTRQGKKCTDILWVGSVDEEGKFISDFGSTCQNRPRRGPLSMSVKPRTSRA